jgi:hypothetical protein
MPNRFLQKVEGNLRLSGNQKAACEGQKSLGKSVHPEALRHSPPVSARLRRSRLKRQSGKGLLVGGVKLPQALADA